MHGSMRALALGLALCMGGAQAQSFGEGKLKGSGGISSIEGSAGGGISPWAVIAGHGERGEWDAQAALSWTDTGDFNLGTGSVSVGWSNRLELSAARMSLGLDALVRNGSVVERRLDLDVIAAKLRLGGDLIYGSGPQWALGAQWKRSRDEALVRAVGAADDADVDVYLSASKLWIDGFFGRRTLANVTLRSTRAHQLGLLGFGEDRELAIEGALAVFVHPDWVLGAEYRSKPDQLRFALEDDWFDVFIGWFPSKRWHTTLAYVDLGSVGGVESQHGYYLSVQASP